MIPAPTKALTQRRSAFRWFAGPFRTICPGDAASRMADMTSYTQEWHDQIAASNMAAAALTVFIGYRHVKTCHTDTCRFAVMIPAPTNPLTTDNRRRKNRERGDEAHH